MKRACFFILILCLSIDKLWAVPAYPYPVEITQPDGTTLTIRMHGDEWFHYTTTEDGYMVAKNRQDFYVYAMVSQAGQIVPTNRVARNANARNVDDTNFLKSIDVNTEISRLRNAQNAASPRKTLRSATQDEEPQRTPNTGSPKFLVLLIEFSDREFDNRTTAQTRYSNLVNQEGYNFNGSTGSVKDFYRASSYGKFSPDFVVMPPVAVPNTAQYYCDDDGARVPQMIIDACNAVNASVNFADYDNDNDGYVDNVLCFVAGWDRARHADNATNVWSHRWSVYPGSNYSGNIASTIFDSKRVYDYFVTSELTGTESSPTKTMVNIGTFVHEFGHILGLPDYYHTQSNSTHPTLGEWSTMCSGSYNNSSRTPPAFSAYDRFFLGWLTPEELTATAQKTLYPLAQVTTPPANTNGQGYLVAANTHNLNGSAPNPNEFFILEYREKTGWDAYLPVAGMLVWHIDYSANAWWANTVNNYSGNTQTAADHMRVYIEPTNGLSQTSPGGAFTTGSFNPNLWSGTNIQRPITNITKNGTASMTFNVTFPVAGTPVATDATNVKRNAFTANWIPSSGAGDYLLSVYYKDGGIKKYDGGGFPIQNVGNVISCNISGLDRTKATTWFYTITAVSGGVSSDESNEISVNLADFDDVTCEYKSNMLANETTAGYTSGGGPIGGHANGITQYAEYYHITEVAKVTGFKMIVQTLQNNSNNPNYAKITMKIWDKGTNGRPNNILYSEDFSFAQIGAAGERTLTFATPTIVPTEFFIGYEIYYAPTNPDVFGVYITNPRNAGGLNTAYLYYDDYWKFIGFNEYYSINSVGLTTSLFLFPNVCTFAPEASFTTTPQQASVNSQVAFSNTSIEAPGTAWLWNFDDGQTSTEKNPTHAYSIAGTYTATLTATNLVGRSTASQQITVQGTSIIWTPQPSSTAWNNSANWTPQSVPSATSRAIIPKNASTYPVLTAPTTVGEILFEPGAELGRQDLLTYNKAFVQLDFSNESSRNRWQMLTNPLQELFMGDMTFGGLPGMDIKAFVTETDQSSPNYEQGVWKSLPAGYIHQFDSGDNFELWLNSDHPTETRGLRHSSANGIITLPHFENSEAHNVHWTHDYNSSAKVSTFHGWEKNGDNYVRKNGTNVSTTRDLDKAYKLTETVNGKFSKHLDFGHGVNRRVYFAATGNPFMSSIDFNRLQENNSSLIGETYWVWNGPGSNNGGSYVTYNKTVGQVAGMNVSLTNILSPMQSFIVERKAGSTGTEIIFDIATVSASKQGGGSAVMKASAQSNDLLEIIASTPQSAFRAVIASHKDGDRIFNGKDSRRFSAGINALPDIYLLKPDAGNNMVAVTANIMNEIKEESLIPLAIATTYEGPVTLSFAGMDTYNARIFFVDTNAQNKKENELTGQARYEYTFNYVPEKVKGTIVANENRFFIRLSPTNLTGIDFLAASNNILIYNRQENTIQVVSGELIQQISVFNLQGGSIYNNASVNAYEHSISGLAPGIYVIKAASKQEVKTMKIIVK